MQWTVNAVKRQTSGYGDTIKTTGFTVSATRHTEMGEHKLELDIPLHMSHPLIGDVVTTDISWTSLDAMIETDELETARIAEALQP